MFAYQVSAVHLSFIIACFIVNCFFFSTWRADKSTPKRLSNAILKSLDEIMDYLRQWEGETVNTVKLTSD